MKENEEILKITDLVKNEIYYFESNVKWILRFDSLTEENILVNGSISESSFYNKKEDVWGQFNDAKNIRKATKKEIYWFLECEKLNKFIKYEEAMKTFKEEPDNTSLVGRYFKALVDGPECTSYKLGEYAKITRVDMKYVYDIKGYAITISRKHLWELMPISWSPDEEGKVNDEIPEYVKCIKGHNCSFHNKVGTIYKVENYDLKNKKLQLENFDNTISYIDFKNPISSNLTDYIISSKAEYDLQNKPKEMDKKEEEFCIKLESQKHLDEIIEFYKEKGYKEYGDSHTYKKNWVVFINPNKKIWQTNIYNNTNHPVKTFEKTYDYEVVHCTTQEEWDFACDKYDKGVYTKEQYLKYGYNTFMMSNFRGWNQKEYFLSDPFYNKSLKIYTFKEYCDKFGYTPDFIEKEEWIPQIGEWVIIDNKEQQYSNKQLEFIGQIKSYESKSNYWITNHNVKGYKIYTMVCCNNMSLRKALPHEIPNNQDNNTIDIGDEVSTSDGNGIVIGITTSNKYLVKGAYKFHNGKGITLIKGNFSDKDDSYYYDLDELTLVKKANKSYIDIAGETVKLVYNVQLPIIGNIPTKTIFTFDIDIPKIKKDTIIELDTNLLKNIKKPIKF
jgi:hypothetical protein